MPERGRTYRFFAPGLSVSSSGPIALAGDEAHHARAVLRLSAGSAVELFDGRGTIARGTLAAVDRRAVTVEIDSTEICRRPGPLVHLAFATPKPKRLDWLLEKASELAAASLRAIIFERSVAHRKRGQATFSEEDGKSSLSPFPAMSESKRRRWGARCLAAAKQSGTNFLPELRPTLPLGEYLALDAAPGEVRLLGDLARDARPLAQAPRPDATGDVHLLIGPEGGLTGEERTCAVAAGFIPVRLGATTLRIETAAAALLAAVTAIYE